MQHGGKYLVVALLLNATCLNAEFSWEPIRLLDLSPPFYNTKCNMAECLRVPVIANRWGSLILGIFYILRITNIGWLYISFYFKIFCVDTNKSCKNETMDKKKTRGSEQNDLRFNTWHQKCHHHTIVSHQVQ